MNANLTTKTDLFDEKTDNFEGIKETENPLTRQSEKYVENSFQKLSQLEKSMETITVPKLIQNYDIDVSGKSITVGTLDKKVFEPYKNAMIEKRKRDLERIETNHLNDINLLTKARNRSIKEAKDFHEQSRANYTEISSKQINMLEDRRKEVKTMFNHGLKMSLNDLETRKQAIKKYVGKPNLETEPLRSSIEVSKNVEQHVRIELVALGGLRNLLPKGQYSVVVSYLTRIGGIPLPWKNPKNNLNKKRTKKNYCCASYGFHHDGDSKTVLTAVSTKPMFIELPPSKKISPVTVYLFELVLLRGRQSPTDMTVGWGILPATSISLQANYGNFRIPLLKGPVDGKITLHSQFRERLCDIKADYWLGNLYASLTPFVDKDSKIHAKISKYLSLRSKMFGIENRSVDDLLATRLEFADEDMLFTARPTLRQEANSIEQKKKTPKKENEKKEQEFEKEEINEELIVSLSVTTNPNLPPPVFDHFEEVENIFEEKDENVSELLVDSEEKRKSLIDMSEHDILMSALEDAMNEDSNSGKISIPILDLENLKDKEKDKVIEGEVIVDDNGEDEGDTLDLLGDFNPNDFVIEIPPTKETLQKSMSYKIKLVSRTVLQDFGFDKLLSWRFLSAILLFCATFFIRNYLHGFAQLFLLSKHKISVYSVDIAWLKCLISYESLPLQAFIIIQILIAPFILQFILFIILAICSALLQSTTKIVIPEVVSNLFAMVGIQSFLDPLYHFLTTKIYGFNDEYQDLLRLPLWFNYHENSPIFGILVDVVFILLSCSLSIMCIYYYLLYVHTNGRTSDIYHRLTDQNGYFFGPIDVEITLREFREIMRKTLNYRGVNKKSNAHIIRTIEISTSNIEKKSSHSQGKKTSANEKIILDSNNSIQDIDNVIKNLIESADLSIPIQNVPIITITVYNVHFKYQKKNGRTIRSKLFSNVHRSFKRLPHGAITEDFVGFQIDKYLSRSSKLTNDIYIPDLPVLHKELAPLDLMKSVVSESKI
eukprot:TRINITY_DN13827_c0_g1_i1.p1 TRINITY_DN13827_c0_g1~~TRINITY_DN13827_c0_g1_i1.p1  ORF type:complete len:998 (+),score=265.60 TRINITY_DN13827_c0_g1_i1:21-3014(+)